MSLISNICRTDSFHHKNEIDAATEKSIHQTDTHIRC